MWPFRRKPAPAADPAPLPLPVLTDREARIKASREARQAKFLAAMGMQPDTPEGTP